jgi:eukaryotic-like serine/threonine-protein kinase
MMESEHWQQISRIVLAAQDRPPPERAAFVREACAGDDSLRREVESLLAYESAAVQFLEHPPPAVGRTATEPDSVIPTGARFGAYEVVARLGSGGMGDVCLARDLTLERMVALKLLPASLTRDPGRVARFRQEARAASALNHPNVCTIHALGETPDGRQFIAMEHIAGETLRQRLTTSHPSVQEVLDIAVQVASALSAAHAAGVVHRDLKPENVMLRPDGLVKVVDFGLAKLTPLESGERDATLTGVRTDAGIVVGTVAYMSPEQARALEVDARTDIWSLGVMLYELVAGRSPFAGQNRSDVLAGILEREPAPIARFEPNVSPELQRIVGKSLRKDREQRYQVMKDLQLDLQALRDDPATRGGGTFVQHPTTQPEPTPSTAPVGALVTRSLSNAQSVVSHLRRHKIGAVLVASALTLIVGGSWWTMSGRWSVAPETPSVAVLPFNTIGGSDQYFADGITEAITTELGRSGGLRVIASNSAFAYRDKTSFREIARDLSVGLVVRGSVQRAGGRVRIDVSLVDTGNDSALWSESYNRELTDVLTVQDDISRQIAMALSKTFGATPTAKVLPRMTTNPDAYDAYLRGLWHLKGRTTGPTTRATRLVAAIEELQRAVDRDPNFALAHAVLAGAYTQRFFYDASLPVFEQKAFVEIERALTINPDQAEAYLARAQLTWNLRNKFPHEEAIADLRRALSLNPNLAEAYLELGKVYYHIGLTDKALDANERSHQLDPGVQSVNRTVRTLIDAGRLEDVRQELDRNGLRLGPYVRGDALLAIGHEEEALEVLSRATSAETADPESDIGSAALLGVVYARLGRRGDAERILAEVSPIAKNPSALSHLHHAQFHIGCTLGLLGRSDEAVRWLTMAVEQGYPSYPRFSTDQSLLPLKGHAGFLALLARLRQDWDRWQKTL